MAGGTLDVRVTGAGEVVGTLVQDGKRAEVLAVDGDAYLKAGKEYWTGPDGRADIFAGKWVQSTDSGLGLVRRATLSPGVLARGLREDFSRALAAVAAGGPPAESMIGGVRAWRASVPGGDVYVSAEKPHRVLRIDAPLRTAGDAAAGVLARTTSRARLDVKPETEDSAADVSAAVGLGAVQVASGGGAYDQNVPVSFVSRDNKLNAPCNAGGCKVAVTVRNESASVTADVVLEARVTSENVLIGSCTSPPKSVKPGLTTALTCQAAGASWKAFYARATAPSYSPKSTPYLVRALALAKSPAPSAVRCSASAKPAAGCPAPEITDAGFDASFTHAKDWWGRPTTAADRAEWRTMIETARGSAKSFPWCAEGKPTTARLSQVGGKYFVAHFDRAKGDLVTAFEPSPHQLAAMRKLSK